MPAPPLLAGPYSPPPVKRGNRIVCLYRDAEAVVTSWTAAPVPWPRCRAVGSRGGSGLLMTDELRRAVVTESAVALRFWFGVSKSAVNHWRRWAGVEGHTTTPGSKAAQRAASDRGAARTRGVELSEAVRSKMSAPAKRDGRKPPVRKEAVTARR